MLKSLPNTFEISTSLLKFGKFEKKKKKNSMYLGCSTVVDKWCPGSLTNTQTVRFIEPRLIIVDEPKSCFGVELDYWLIWPNKCVFFML